MVARPDRDRMSDQDQSESTVRAGTGAEEVPVEAVLPGAPIVPRGGGALGCRTSAIASTPRRLEAMEKFARLDVSVTRRGLQVDEGRGSIVAGELD